jgi:hypothetical protein
MQIFRILFHNNGKLYQLHARQVSQSDIYGFVELRELLFEQHSSVVIDPSEERLKSEFAGVEKIFVPVHAIVRIDQVEAQGQNKILELDGHISNITPFPLPGKGGDR